MIDIHDMVGIFLAIYGKKRISDLTRKVDHDSIK